MGNAEYMGCHQELQSREWLRARRLSCKPAFQCLRNRSELWTRTSTLKRFAQRGSPPCNGPSSWLARATWPNVLCLEQVAVRWCIIVCLHFMLRDLYSFCRQHLDIRHKHLSES